MLLMALQSIHILHLPSFQLLAIIPINSGFERMLRIILLDIVRHPKYASRINTHFKDILLRFNPVAILLKEKEKQIN